MFIKLHWFDHFTIFPELGDKGIPIPNTKDLYFVNPVLTLNPVSFILAFNLYYFYS